MLRDYQDALAQLLVDEQLRGQLHAMRSDPQRCRARWLELGLELSAAEQASLAAIDATELERAAQSLIDKRAAAVRATVPHTARVWPELELCYRALLRERPARVAARGKTPHTVSLGLFAEGFVAKTCSGPTTAAFWLRALDENSGAGRRDGFHHGLLDSARVRVGPGAAELTRFAPELIARATRDPLAPPWAPDLFALELARACTRDDALERKIICRYPVHRALTAMDEGWVSVTLEQNPGSYRVDARGLRWAPGASD